MPPKIKKKDSSKGKGRTGRPRIEIDWETFNKLCALHCTLLEIAEFFECSIDTIENRVKEKKGMTFSEYFKVKSSPGKISLRRIQFTLAKKNAAMAIFLGKNYLGQSDKIGLEHSGSIMSISGLILEANRDDRNDTGTDDKG